MPSPHVARPGRTALSYGATWVTCVHHSSVNLGPAACVAPPRRKRDFKQHALTFFRWCTARSRALDNINLQCASSLYASTRVLEYRGMQGAVGAQLHAR